MTNFRWLREETVVVIHCGDVMKRSRGLRGYEGFTAALCSWLFVAPPWSLPAIHQIMRGPGKSLKKVFFILKMNPQNYFWAQITYDLKLNENIDYIQWSKPIRFLNLNLRPSRED